MATRDDVARLAGVSSSTVSYAISGRRKISDATRERVEQAMRDLDYTPNAFARGLAGSRGGIIALHYPSSTRGYSATEFEYVSQTSARARLRGYHVLLWTGAADDVDGLRGLVSQGLVDGVILMEVGLNDPRIEVLEASSTPFTMIGRPQDPAARTFVDNDYDAMARLAIDHVAGLGHHQVLFLGQTTRPLDRGEGPMARTRRALEAPARERGVRLDLVEVDNTAASGHAAFEAYLALTPRPSAVIAFNEAALAGMAHACALAGVRIPDDLSVVALSLGDDAAELMSPPMTTVSPPVGIIAEYAVDGLVGLIDQRPGPAMHALVAPLLTVRASSSTAP
ncbi:MAG: LacI family DNA-binding transcriptional regulator [Propioniciclava sp.]|uniref:LacI family DNA-binding transcriptional regulator n=1 Tax=Propioniciclava sp. TaxID=2038686 RepID=UPI0039E510CF